MGWYRRYVRWHGKKHPAEMGAAEVEAFLTHLAVERKLVAVILLKHPQERARGEFLAAVQVLSEINSLPPSCCLLGFPLS